MELGNMLRAAARFLEAQDAYDQAMSLLEGLLAGLPAHVENADSQWAVALKEQIGLEQSKNVKELMGSNITRLKEEAKQAAINTRARIPQEWKFERNDQPALAEFPARVQPGEALNRLLVDIGNLRQQGREVSTAAVDVQLLNQVQFVRNRVTIALFKNKGELSWPFALQEPIFVKERADLTALARQAYRQVIDKGKVEPAVLRQMHEDFVALDKRFRAATAGMQAPRPAEDEFNYADYVDYKKAKRFLSDFKNALNDLEAGVHYPGDSLPQLRTVSELVDFMIKNRMLFAPMKPGEERTYRELHKKLAAYYSALNSSPAKPW
jgi:hypothetical protein